MASSSALNYIPFRSDSFKTLPNSRSFPQLSLPTPSKSQLSPLCLANYSTPTNTLTSTINTTKYTTTTTSDDYKTQISSPTTVSLSDMWREIQGCNNWENLLDPLHPLLRREIIRYGEFVTACYKAFDLDPNSSRFLNCKYGKKRMLSEVGMPDSGYQVVKYIYASPADVIQNYYNPSPSSCSSRWIGFIAVSDDKATRRLGRRDIVVTFRGTVTSQEWVANFMSSLTPARLDPHDPRPEVKVEQGFLSLYTSEETSKFGVGSCREQVLSEIWRLLRKHKGEKMSLTMGGHSMGSALGVLVAYDVAELGLNRLGGREDEESVIPVAVFSFGGPRVGNLGFKKRCEELGVRVLRITNVNDPITKLPGVLFNNDNNNNNNKIRVSNLGFSCYAHVGVELLLDFFSVQNPSCVHDLGSYINCLLNHSNNKINHSNSNEGFGIGFRNDQKILTDLVGKGREWMLSSHNTINVLPGVFAAAGNHHAVLGWVSGDLINSWGNQLLFGLVLLFM